MSHHSSLPWRVWRLRPWNTNPLMRASDRCVSALGLLIIVGMLLAVPLAAAVGTSVYTRTADRISAERLTKSAVQAVVSSAPEETQPAGPVEAARYRAQVQWQRDGVTATATTEVAQTAKPGSTIQIWLGADGKPTDPPQQTDAAAWNGIAAGLGLLVGAACAALALLWLVTRLLDHLQAVRWETALRGLGRPIGK